MKLRVKEVARNKGMTLQKLSKQLNITYQALNVRMTKNPSIQKVQEIADKLNCPLIELLELDPKEFYHVYDEHGNYHGINKVN